MPAKEAAAKSAKKTNDISVKKQKANFNANFTLTKLMWSRPGGAWFGVYGTPQDGFPTDVSVTLWPFQFTSENESVGAPYSRMIAGIEHFERYFLGAPAHVDDYLLGWVHNHGSVEVSFQLLFFFGQPRSRPAQAYAIKAQPGVANLAIPVGGV